MVKIEGTFKPVTVACTSKHPVMKPCISCGKCCCRLNQIIKIAALLLGGKISNVKFLNYFNFAELKVELRKRRLCCRIFVK